MLIFLYGSGTSNTDTDNNLVNWPIINAVFRRPRWDLTFQKECFLLYQNEIKTIIE